MFFLPVAFLIFLAFILFLPLLFILGYFHIVTLGFEKLGISPEITIFLLFLILIGSSINIPLGRKKLVYTEESRFFGLLRRPKIEAQGIAINLGGAVVPILLSFYFLFLILRQGFSLQPVLIAIILMTLLSKSISRVIPGKGISLPALIPPVFSNLEAGFFASAGFNSHNFNDSSLQIDIPSYSGKGDFFTGFNPAHILCPFCPDFKPGVCRSLRLYCRNPGNLNRR